MVSSKLTAYAYKGWDGSDAEPIAIDATREARAFVTSLPPGTRQPEVSAGYDGSIGLSWSGRDMQMFAHFPPSGSMDFSFQLGRFGWNHSKRISARDPEILEEIRPTFGYIAENLVASILITTLSVTILSIINTSPPEAEALPHRKALPGDRQNPV
jgi:hypothetical protein